MNDALQLFLTVGVAAGAVAAITGVVTIGWRTARRVVHIADAVGELVPNGGSSVKDQVTRIEKKLDEHIAQHHGGETA